MARLQSRTIRCGMTPCRPSGMRCGVLAWAVFGFAVRECVAGDLLPPGREFRDIMPAGLVLRGFAFWSGLALRVFILRAGLPFIFVLFDFVTLDFLRLAMVWFPEGMSNGCVSQAARILQVGSARSQP